jgi:hypothetical protein
MNLTNDFSTKAVNLYQLAKLTNNPLVMKMTKSIYNNNSLATIFDYHTGFDFKVQAEQLTHAGLMKNQMGWRRLNEQSTNVNGDTKKIEGELLLIDNDIEIDRAAVKAYKAGKLKTDPVKRQFDIYTESFGYDFNDTLLNFDPTGDPRRPAGLRYICSNPKAFDLDPNFVLKTVNEGAGLNLNRGLMTGADATGLLNDIDTWLDESGAGEGTGIVLLCNYKLMNNLTNAMANSRLFSVDKDQFGRKILKYRDVEIRKMVAGIDGVTELIPSNETLAGDIDVVNGKYTSVYLWDTRQESTYVWQPHTMELENQGTIGTKTNVHIAWGFGRMFLKDRAVVRLKGIRLRN